MLSSLLFRIRSLWRRRSLEGELEEELRFHLEQETEKWMCAGHSRSEAARRARLAFGGPEQVKEQVREERGTRWLEEMLQDLRYGLRTLRLSPGFFTVAVLTLGLGIGANTAIFQLLDAVFLRPLPVSDPSSLAVLQIHGGNGGLGVVEDVHNLTWPLFAGIRDRQQGFSHVFAWADERVVSGMAPETRQLRAVFATGELFGALRLAPGVGRLLTPADDQPGCASPGIVLSHAFWQRAYGAQPSVIGQRLIVFERPLVIVGVAPAGFLGLEVGTSFDIALPLCAKALFHGGREYFERRDVFWLNVMGRLQPNQTLAQASAQLRGISPGLFAETKPVEYPAQAVERYQQFRLEAVSGAAGVSSLRDEYRRSLTLLLGLTCLILFMASANLANLMLARATARRREFALRVALGGSRGRLLRQVLMEGALLATAGSALGLVLAAALSRLVVASLATTESALSLDLSISGHVLAFTAGVAAVSCLVFALVPALRTLRSDPAEALKSGGRSLTADRERFTFQRALIVMQISTSLVLVTGALLLVGTFRHLVTLDPGFRIKGILIAGFDMSRTGMPAPQVKPMVQALVDEVRAMPQVEAAAATTNVILHGGTWSLGLAGELQGTSRFTWVSPGYFTALDTPLLQGRDFTREDQENGPKVVIVNETFVKRYFPSTDPLGKRFRSASEPGYPETEYRIIGICRDTRYSDLRQVPPPQSYAPLAQHPSYGPWAALYVRSSAPLGALSQEIKQRIMAAHPGFGVEFRQLEAELQDSLLRERLLALLSGFFGLLALLLAAVGLYGVMAYLVAGRTNEIGIRLALGATPRAVMQLILREMATLTGGGLALGIAGAFLFAHAARSVLFGVSAGDPLAYGVAVVLLIAVAGLGSYLPARRAARVNPVAALRQE